MTVIDWLLDADPSIRWQVMRDLTHEQADVIATERSRVAIDGWGARLLPPQAPDGQWGGRRARRVQEQGEQSPLQNLLGGIGPF